MKRPQNPAGLQERCKLPQRSPWRSPGRKKTFVIYFSSGNVPDSNEFSSDQKRRLARVDPTPTTEYFDDSNDRDRGKGKR